MALEHLNHYAFQNVPTIYDEEALTVLELCSRIGVKVNELVTLFNQLEKKTEYELTEQDKEIATHFQKLMATMPAEVRKWLEEHPEVTTTLQDGEIVEGKLHATLAERALKDYVTPEMFGAPADGEGDDTAAVQAAIDTGKPVLLRGNYRISSVLLDGGKEVTINGEVTVTGDIGFVLHGHYNKITGRGSIVGNYENMAIKVWPGNPAVFTYYNIIDVARIAAFDCGVLLYNPETNGVASYFNVVEKVNFTGCKTGLRLLGYANGNKLCNLTFYECGVGGNLTRGCVELVQENNTYPIENMLNNISTTNSTDCISIYISGKSMYNQFSQMQFENGGTGARGIYCTDREQVRENIISGLMDINNQGSNIVFNNQNTFYSRGFTVSGEVHAKQIHKPFGCNLSLKSNRNFTDKENVPVMQLGLLNGGGVIIKCAASLTSGVANISHPLCETATLHTRNLNGTYCAAEEGGFTVDATGMLYYKTPNAVIGTSHYTKCYLDFEIMTNARDSAYANTPRKYGFHYTLQSSFEEA